MFVLVTAPKKSVVRTSLAASVALSCAAAGLITTTNVTPAAASSRVEPKTPKFTAPVDEVPKYRRENECSQTKKPGPLFVEDLIRKTYGPATFYILRKCPKYPRSGHHAGRALDWMQHVNKPKEKKAVYDFIHWLNKSERGVQHANARRLGMMYIIWDDKKFYYFRGGRATWEPYYTTAWVKEYDQADQKLKPVRKKVACTSTKPEESAIRGKQYDNICHRNHLHISFTHEGAAAETSFYAAAGKKPAPKPKPKPAPKPGPKLNYKPCASMWPAGTGIPQAPQAALGFRAIEPQRLLDTRSGTGTYNGQKCRLQPKKSLNVKVLGQGGVPTTGVAAVVLNVVGVKPSGNTFISAYPSGGYVPNTSSVNVAKGQNTAALVTVPVGRDGRVALYSGVADADVVVDVVGYYTTSGGDKFTPMTGKRVLDKRMAARTWTGLTAGVPSDATAIMANITGDKPSGPGFVAVNPWKWSGSPKTSNLNMNPKRAVANRSLMKTKNGRATVYSNVPTRAVIDVNGWFSKSGKTNFYALTPTRIVDSRGYNVGGASTLRGGKAQTVQIAGKGGVPVGAKAAVVTLTSDKASTSQFLSMWRADQKRPVASDLNTAKGQPQANMVLVPLDSRGRAKIFVNRGTTEVIVDALGYYK